MVDIGLLNRINNCKQKIADLEDTLKQPYLSSIVIDQIERDIEVEEMKKLNYEKKLFLKSHKYRLKVKRSQSKLIKEGKHLQRKQGAGGKVKANIEMIKHVVSEMELDSAADDRRHGTCMFVNAGRKVGMRLKHKDLFDRGNVFLKKNNLPLMESTRTMAKILKPIYIYIYIYKDI